MEVNFGPGGNLAVLALAAPRTALRRRSSTRVFRVLRGSEGFWPPKLEAFVRGLTRGVLGSNEPLIRSLAGEYPRHWTPAHISSRIPPDGSSVWRHERAASWFHWQFGVLQVRSALAYRR